MIELCFGHILIQKNSHPYGARVHQVWQISLSCINVQKHPQKFHFHHQCAHTSIKISLSSINVTHILHISHPNRKFTYVHQFAHSSNFTFTHQFATAHAMFTSIHRVHIQTLKFLEVLLYAMCTRKQNNSIPKQTIFYFSHHIKRYFINIMKISSCKRTNASLKDMRITQQSPWQQSPWQQSAHLKSLIRLNWKIKCRQLKNKIFNKLCNILSHTVSKQLLPYSNTTHLHAHNCFIPDTSTHS